MPTYGSRAWFQQSPIKIDTAKTHFTELPELTFDYVPAWGVIKGEEFILEWPSPCHLVFNGMRCPLLKAHFHAPAEHVVNGARASVEMHLVHQVPGYPDAWDSAYVVVGVLLRGPTAQKQAGRARQHVMRLVQAAQLRPAAASASTAKSGKAAKPPTAEPTHPRILLDLAQHLPTSRAHYRYEGSLTTEPYDEVVSWVVLRDHGTLEGADEVYVEDHTRHPMRRPQSLDRRFVLRSFER